MNHINDVKLSDIMHRKVQQENLQEEKARLESRLQMVPEASGLGGWEYDHVNDRTLWNLALCHLTMRLNECSVTLISRLGKTGEIPSRCNV